MWKSDDDAPERGERPRMPVEIKLGLAALFVVCAATIAHLSNRMATNIVEARKSEGTIARLAPSEPVRTRTVTSVLDQAPETVGSIRPRPPQMPAR